MKIYNSLGIEILDVAVTDDSYRYRVIMGENALTIMFSMVSYIDIPVGSYVDYQASRYTLLKPQNFTKNNTRDFEYTLILDGPEAVLSWFKLRDFSGRLKFSHTAKPQEHLQLLVDNLNERDSGWSVGSYVDSVEKVISFNHTSCNDALRQMAEAFNTEYEIIGKQISLRRVEYNKANPLALSYGFGNGFKSGVKRENSGDSKAIEILYVQGGERNISPTIYGSQELLLPKSKTLKFDGSKFEGEAGFVLSASREYVSSADGAFIKRNDKPLSNKIEDSLDCSNIYPSRVGVVSGVEEISSAQNFYDILDNQIPAALDYHECLIEGEKMTIVFQSGMLAGREFDCSYVHNDKRFKIVPQEIDGMIMPSGSYLPQIGDSYAIFGIQLPTDYISNDSTKTGASWDMFREAVRYMYSNEESKFTFSGELDPMWASTDWVNIGGKIKLGGFVSFTDSQFQTTPALIRIVGVRDYINNPHKPQIELSNVTSGGGYGSALKDIANTETIIENAKKEVVRFAKRGFREAKETAKMLENSLLNFSGAINPVTVQTMQLLVGDESLQFEFVANQNSTAPIPHNETFNPATKQFTSSAGIIQHKTLGITDVSSSRTASDYKWWSLPEYVSAVLDQQGKSYYLYAKVGKTNNAGTFLLSETAIAIEQVSGFYHLLVGILNSENDGDRSYSPMYGYSELTPGRLMIKKLISPSGNVYFDLDKGNGDGEIAGNIKFRASDNSLKTVEQAIDEVEVGGRNLMLNSEAQRDWFFAVQTSELLTVGQQYTLSFDVIGDVNGLVFLNPSISGNISKGQIDIWRRVSIVFTFIKDDYAGIEIYPHVYGATNVRRIKLEKGNKATDWSPSSEDVQSSINTAQNAANTANQSVSSLNTYVDGAFKDGVIDSAEAKAIEKYINTVNTEYDKAINSYNVVYANSYLEGTPKTNLLNSKVTLAGAKDSLMSAISTAIADGKTTVSEKAAVDAAYASYKSAFGSYSTALENANKAIQQKLDSLSTSKVNAIDIGDRNLVLDSLGTYSGINALHYYNLSEPLIVGQEYAVSVKGDVGTGANFNVWVNSDMTRALNLPATGIAKGTFVYQGGANPSRISVFSENSGNASTVYWVKIAKGNKATADWTPAPEDVLAEIDNIQIGGRNLVLNSENARTSTFVTYNDTLSEPLKIGQSYILSYGDLSVDKGLIHFYIRIASTGFSELLDIQPNTPFAPNKAYDTVMIVNENQNFTYSVSKVKIEKGNKATDWTPAPEDTQKVLDDMSSDNKLTAQEKSVALKEWQAIQGEYTRLSTLATQLGVSNTLSTPYTNLANYINPLLSSMTVTSDIVGSTFRSYFTAYYNASTDLQNALTSKVQSNVSNLKPAGKNYLINSRTDSLVGWGEYGGTMSVVTDAQYGKVVEYSRPAGGGDFMKVFSIDTSELKNTELVYYCIAKPPTSGMAVFNFGGWNETFTMLNNNSPYRDIGSGWRMYYKVFTAGSAINSGGSFGLNSVGGTWRFHSFGVAKGNTPPADWDASPKEIDFLKQGYRASTDIEGGVVQTAVLLLRNALEQVTAGMSGLGDDNIGMWAGGTYQEALNSIAKIILRKDGSGQLAGGNITWDAAGALELLGKITAGSGKIGGLDIFSNSLKSASMSFSETPVESLASLISPSSVSISNQSSWSAYSNTGTATAYSQNFVIPVDSQIKFKATATPWVSGLDRRWSVTVQQVGGSVVFSQTGNGAITGQLFTVNVPAGTYVIRATASCTVTLGQTPYDEASITGETSGVIYAYGYNFQTKIGNDGFYSFWDVLKYIYYSSTQGLVHRGAIDIPAGLGGASINSLGNIGSHWGKITGNGQNPGQVYKSGNNYTIYHYLGNTDYSLILTPISANVPYFSSKSANTVVVTCAGGFDFVLIRTK